MQQTLEQKGRMIEGQRGIRARIYRWKFMGGFGFATLDSELPVNGKKPRTNFFLHSQHFTSKSDLKVINEHGDLVEFDVEPQELIRGQAIEAKRIRLIKG